MGKKTQPGETIAFEESLEKLEEIVSQLENGQLGLSDSLARYEEGVRHLKHCHTALQDAEQKIEQLTSVDQGGEAVTKPFDAAPSELEQKQRVSSSRRPQSLDESDEEADVDTQKGLF